MGAEVFGDHDLPRVRIVAQEAQDVGDGGTAKPVDRLVVVTRHRDVPVSRREQLHQLELRVVRVLEFVNEDVLEAALVGVENVGPRAQKPQREHDLVAEIDLVVERHQLVVLRVRRAQLCLGRRPVQLFLIIGARPQPGRARQVFVGRDVLVLAAAEQRDQRL